MHKMYLVLGDWSNDGHGKTEKILVETPSTVVEVQRAYKDSCKLTGFSFHAGDSGSDYTETDRDWRERSKYEICCEYEDSGISDEVLVLLDKFKFPFMRDIENCGNFLDDDLFVVLWMWFIRLSLPDFTYEIVKDDIPVINGYWNKELNESFGYGLYN